MLASEISFGEVGMQKSYPSSVEEWSVWFERVSREVLRRPGLDVQLDRQFQAGINDMQRLKRLRRKIEGSIYRLDQDSLAAELLCRVLQVARETDAVNNIRKRLDDMSTALLVLLQTVCDRLAELAEHASRKQ